MKNKLKNNKGESLGEVLVALLISSLGILMLAGMLTSSSNIVMKSKLSMKDYYNENNRLEAQDSNDIDGSLDISIGGSLPGIEDVVPTLIPSVAFYKNEKNKTDEEIIAYAKR